VIFEVFMMLVIFDVIESYIHHVVHDCIIVCTTLSMFITHQKLVFLGFLQNRLNLGFLGPFGSQAFIACLTCVRMELVTTDACEH
jgi:hypothetical protein